MLKARGYAHATMHSGILNGGEAILWGTPSCVLKLSRSEIFAFFVD